MSVIAVYSIKGGVGKTTTAVNLAWEAWHRSQRVLLWDLDPQGAASFYLRVRARVKGGARRLLRRDDALTEAIKGSDFDGLDLLPADFSYRKLDVRLHRRGGRRRKLDDKLAPLRAQYDLIVLDCAPGITLVADAIFHAVDALLVPTIPNVLSMRTLVQLRRHLRDEGLQQLPVLPLLSMVDRRKQLHREGEAAAAADGSFLTTAIPYSAIVERMGVHRAPLGATAPGSALARTYAQLWLEVSGKLSDAS